MSALNGVGLSVMSDKETASTPVVSYFQRVIIVGTILFVAGLIVISFSAQGYVLSGASLSLVCLIVILCLSETFDQFSIAKLFSVSRKASELQEKNTQLNKENSELQDRIFKLYQITSSNSQSAALSTTNNHIFLGDRPQVQSATPEEVATSKPDDIAAPLAEPARVEVTAIETQTTFGEPQVTQELAAEDSIRMELRKIRRSVEHFAVQRYCRERQIFLSEVHENVKISSGSGGALPDVDPIGYRPIIYDAYIRQPDRETFIEVTVDLGYSPVLMDSLYIRITKAFFYKLVSSRETNFVLLVISLPERFDRLKRFRSSSARKETLFEGIMRAFEKARLSGFLFVEQIQLTDEDITSLPDNEE